MRRRSVNTEHRFQRYQELQRYVGWTAEDAARVQSVSDLLRGHLAALVDDFYAEIERHSETMKVITAGAEQISRLKGTLRSWLQELLAGPYDRDYVARRWKAGWRHVEIGLDQVYTNVALSRLRRGLQTALHENWAGDVSDLAAVRTSLNLLLDLDLAIIEDAYQAEHMARHQRAERLAAFRTLVEAAPSMIVILRRDQTIAYFSPFAEEVTGHASKDVVGKTYCSIFTPEAALRATIDRKKQEILAGIPMRGFECPILCKDGSTRWMVWNAQLLQGYEDEPSILAVGQDITSLKQAQEQALQSERLAAIGQMMTGLAHESGNALARSQACLEMLSFTLENQPKALELIDRVQAAQDHLKQLYEEVRNYAAPIKLDIELCNVRAIWRQAWDNLALVRQQKPATLTERLDGLDLRLAVDQFRLGQVFRNIFDNALAACDPPVEVEIIAMRTSLHGQSAIQLGVRDNGPGLTQEQKQRIFEPFFTTKTKGTGLGMAIAKRIVEAHGGAIAAGSAPHRGAEIIVTLPSSNRP